MERNFLKKLGITDKAVIDSIMERNGEDINTAKGKSSTTELEAQLKLLKKQISDKDLQIKERDTQLEQAKKSSGDNEGLRLQIEEGQRKNAEAKKASEEAHKKETHNLQVTYAAQLALIGAGVKNVKAIMPFVNLDDAELEDGNIKGFEETITNLKTGDDTKFLFNEEKKTTFTGLRAGESGDGPPGGDKVTASSLGDAIHNHYKESKGE